MRRDDKSVITVNARKIFVLTCATACLLGACSEFPDDTIDTSNVQVPKVDFDYISVSDGQIRTLHELKYKIAVAGDFYVTEPKNRIDHFNNTPYKISLAAFISEDSALMVHAEEVADSSGTSDYSHLAPAEWPSEKFRSSGPNCLQVPAEDVEEEHDLHWLRDNGFEPSGSLLFVQYFTTSPDMNTEIVISILQQVASCDEGSAHSETIEKFQAQTSITEFE